MEGSDSPPPPPPDAPAANDTTQSRAVEAAKSEPPSDGGQSSDNAAAGQAASDNAATAQAAADNAATSDPVVESPAPTTQAEGSTGTYEVGAEWGSLNSDYSMVDGSGNEIQSVSENPVSIEEAGVEAAKREAPTTESLTDSAVTAKSLTDSAGTDSAVTAKSLTDSAVTTQALTPETNAASQSTDAQTQEESANDTQRETQFDRLLNSSKELIGQLAIAGGLTFASLGATHVTSTVPNQIEVSRVSEASRGQEMTQESRINPVPGEARATGPEGLPGDQSMLRGAGGDGSLIEADHSGPLASPERLAYLKNLTRGNDEAELGQAYIDNDPIETLGQLNREEPFDENMTAAEAEERIREEQVRALENVISGLLNVRDQINGVAGDTEGTTDGGSAGRSRRRNRTKQ